MMLIFIAAIVIPIIFLVAWVRLRQPGVNARRLADSIYRSHDSSADDLASDNAASLTAVDGPGTPDFDFTRSLLALSRISVATAEPARSLKAA